MKTTRQILKDAWSFLVRLQREIGYDDCMGMAAQIAYYMLLSTFPFFIFILSLLSALPVGRSLEPAIFESLSAQMPPEAASFVMDVVQYVLPTRSGGLTVMGALVSLWSGSMAVGAMITTINRAYNLRPRRNMFHQKMLAIGLTLSLSAILLVSAGIVLVGPRLTHTVFEALQLASPDNSLWTDLRLVIAGLLALAAVGLLYYYAPEAHQKALHILPGTVTATLLWLAANFGFRLFIQNFGHYNTTYGSLAALVILMLWFWLTGFIFLLGAEINALMLRLEHEAGRFPATP